MEREKSDVLVETVRLQAARAVACGDLPDDVLTDVGRRLGDLRVTKYIKWLDICMYGICIDLDFPWDIWQHGVFDEIFNDGLPVHRLGFETVGLERPEVARVRVEYRIDELAAKVQPRLNGLRLPQDPIPC